MKLRVIATFFAILAISAGSVSAQTIGVFSDPAGADCNPTGLAFILFIPGGSIPEITGAEFGVTGISTNTNFLINAQPNPLANVAIGAPMGTPPSFFVPAGVQPGANIAFPTCQAGIITLFAMQIINTGGDTAEHTLSVGPHFNPANPNFVCSLVTLCDGPAFTKVCVSGGEAFLNSPTRNCTVAVEETSWSAVKRLYN